MSRDFFLLLAKHLCNFMYAYPYPLVPLVRSTFFLLLVSCDNTASQYCHPWSQESDLDFIPGASYGALVCCQALDMLSEIWGRGCNPWALLGLRDWGGHIFLRLYDCLGPPPPTSSPTLLSHYLSYSFSTAAQLVTTNIEA